MPLWVRYDALRGTWEVSPNESEHYFSDLLENHPREVTFGRWIEFEAFADAKNMGVYRQPEESFGGRRVRVYNDGDFLREVRKRRSLSDAWGPNQVNTPPAVAPVGKARIYFDKITNKLKVSENGGPWKDLGASVPVVLDQTGLPSSIPLKIISPVTSGLGQEPTNFTNLQAWWKADAGAYNDAGSTLATNGQSVQQWNDQSGNSRNLSQATSSKRPIFTTNYQNGKPALVFDGTDDEYTDTTFVDNLYAVGAFTVMLVHKTISGGNSIPFMIYDGALATRIQCYMITGAVRTWNNDGTDDVLGKTTVETNVQITTHMHGGGNIYVGSNDTRDASLSSTASGNTSLSGARTFYTRYSGGYANMALLEMIVFNSNKSESDRKEVEKYLANKYNITLPYVQYGNVDLLRIEDGSGNAIFRVSNAGDVYVGSTKLNVP